MSHESWVTGWVKSDPITNIQNQLGKTAFSSCTDCQKPAGFYQFNYMNDPIKKFKLAQVLIYRVIGSNDQDGPGLNITIQTSRIELKLSTNY